MSQSDRHRQGTVQMSFWASRELRQQIVDYQHAKEMKAYSEAITDLLEKRLSSNTDSVNYQKCSCRSEIPAHYGKFVRCLKDGRTITEEQCQACKQYGLIKLPLITMEKLGETNSKLRQSNQELKNENLILLKESQDLDSNTKDGLLRTIKEKDRDMRIIQQSYREAQEVSIKQSKTIAELQTELSTLREATDLLLRKTTEEEPQAMPQKVEPNPPILKRVIEEKKTTTEEFAPSPQQKSTLPTQQKTLLPEIIQCPDIEETVNIEEICKKICQKRDTCIPYEQIIVKKAIPKQ